MLGERFLGPEVVALLIAVDTKHSLSTPQSLRPHKSFSKRNHFSSFLYLLNPKTNPKPSKPFETSPQGTSRLGRQPLRSSATFALRLAAAGGLAATGGGPWAKTLESFEGTHSLFLGFWGIFGEFLGKTSTFGSTGSFKNLEQKPTFMNTRLFCS